MNSIDPATVLALIPARGGSKGLPGKNILPFHGKPLISHTIHIARESATVRRILVSTDDEKIAAVSRASGAEVPFLRPAEMAQDASPVLAAALHALDWLEENEHWTAEWLLLLQPTSPLRTADDIRNATTLLRQSDADAVLAVSETKSHPNWVKTLTPDGFLAPFIEGQIQPSRRQELPHAFAINGLLYLVRTSTFRDELTFSPKKTLPLMIPTMRAIDIDTETDFRMAEFAYGIAMNG